MFDMDILYGPMMATCLIGVTTLVLLYWYSKKQIQYWQERGVPTAKSYPFVGSTFRQFSNNFHDVEVERYKELGPIYGHYEANRPLLSVADPAILRDIFVKDFQYFSSRRSLDTGDEIVGKMLSVVNGEDWKRIRNIITPTFTTGKIKRMLSIFKDCSNTLVQNFKEGSKKGPIDAKRIYGAFTMDIIASSAFSTKLDSHNDPDNAFVKTARKVFTRAVNWRFIMLIIAPWLMRIFKIAVFAPDAMDFFRSATLQIIEERKKTGQTRNDFLQLLLDTAKEVKEDTKLQEAEEEGDLAENYGEDDTQHAVMKTASKKNLDMNELVAQCVIFFLAGYDTTASTLSFVSYNLALNPDVQEKVHQDVVDAIRENNGELNYETIQSMKYLDNVISETLRLYPPAVRLERQADADYKLGNTGITIKKGMIVTVPNYAMHRDPKLFPDPEKFDPDRFTAEERAKRDQYAYLPFGAGPRNCVGMRFALMEVKVCLVHVIANFKIKKNAKTQVPLQYYRGQGLLQPKEILLDFEERNDNPIRK